MDVPKGRHPPGRQGHRPSLEGTAVDHFDRRSSWSSAVSGSSVRVVRLVTWRRPGLDVRSSRRRQERSPTVGAVVVVFGALVVLLVIVGGFLMARVLTDAADRSDVWRRWGWRSNEDGEGTDGGRAGKTR
jgi:hypothetical protein